MDSPSDYSTLASDSLPASPLSCSAPTFKIISIEGNIGSGKSTLLAHLKEDYKNNPNIVFLKEPVDQWETIKDKEGNTMLKKFYADPHKYAFPFQMMAYISRLTVLKTAIRENPNAIFISERSLFTDKFVFAKMLYDMGNIEDVSYQIYLTWFDALIAECPIEQAIYVRTDPDVCHKRTQIRGREGEEGIPLDYLKSCHEYHEKMMNNEIQQYIPGDHLVLNGNVDIYQNKDQLETWKKQVGAFIGADSTHKLEKGFDAIKLDLSSKFALDC